MPNEIIAAGLASQRRVPRLPTEIARPFPARLACPVRKIPTSGQSLPHSLFPSQSLSRFLAGLFDFLDFSYFRGQSRPLAIFPLRARKTLARETVWLAARERSHSLKRSITVSSLRLDGVPQTSTLAAKAALDTRGGVHLAQRLGVVRTLSNC